MGVVHYLIILGSHPRLGKSEPLKKVSGELNIFKVSQVILMFSQDELLILPTYTEMISRTPSVSDISMTSAVATPQRPKLSAPLGRDTSS